jgi:hypothetical protein
MELEKLTADFTVCKVDQFPEGIGDYCFVSKTYQELSVVCKTEDVPDPTLEREDGWKGFRITGTLDFSLIGILAPIAALLAEHMIGIFVVSTYNTDYIFVKKENFDKAQTVLSAAGYTWK